MTFRNSTIRPDLRHSARNLIRYYDDMGGKLVPVSDLSYLVPRRMPIRPATVYTLPSFKDLDHFARAVVEGSIYEEQP